TAVAAGGIVAAPIMLARRLRASVAQPDRLRIDVLRGALASTWIMALLLLVSQELRWHTWPIMHARLLLPVPPAAPAGLRAGWHLLRRPAPAAVDWTMRASIAATTALLLTQHLIDLARVPFRIAH